MWHTINRVAYAVRVARCLTHSNYIFIYKTAEKSSRFPCMQNILQSCVADNTMAVAASAEDSQQSAGCHGWLLRQDIANETTITKTHTKLCNFIFSKCFRLSRELSLLFSLSIVSAADTDIQTRLQFAKTFHLSKVCTFLDFFSHPLPLRSSFIFGEEKITESRAHEHTHTRYRCHSTFRMQCEWRTTRSDRCSFFGGGRRRWRKRMVVHFAKLNYYLNHLYSCNVDGEWMNEYWRQSHTTCHTLLSPALCLRCLGLLSLIHINKRQSSHCVWVVEEVWLFGETVSFQCQQNRTSKFKMICNRLWNAQPNRSYKSQCEICSLHGTRMHCGHGQDRMPTTTNTHVVMMIKWKLSRWIYMFALLHANC